MDAGTKLLLIDDDAGWRRSLRTGLAQRGYQVDEAAEGLSALKLIEANLSAAGAKGPYACIVAELNLPDVSGLKLLEVIKSHRPEVPVILVSASGDEATRAAVTARHGDGYLVKPFGVEEVAAVLGRLERPAAAAHPAPAAAAKPVSAFALVKLRDGQDLGAAFGKLRALEHVVRCDAVLDDYDVVLAMTGASPADIEKRLRALPEVAAVTVDAVVPATVDPGIAGFIAHYEAQRATAEPPAGMASYLFVDVAPGRLGDVYPRLCFLDGAVACDATRGAHDAIVQIRRQSFQQIDRLLAHEVGAIDGIVRTRSVKIINMFAM
jgi:DNA-binding response OmpR family regulator